MNDEPRDSTADGISAEQAVDLATAISSEMSKAVVGQQEMIRHIVAAFFAAGHVLLEGVPGLGKTLTVLALARTFGGKFARVQFTPDLMPMAKKLRMPV